MFTRSTWRHGVVCLALLCIAGSGGCRPPASSQQPPSPAGYAGSEGNGYLVCYRWQDGPLVMICADVKPDITKSGEQASGPPWHRTITGLVEQNGGGKVDWKFETNDGKSIKTTINGTVYDLANGGLFLVKTKESPTQVQQLNRELPQVQPTKESCQSVAAGNREIAELLGLEQK